jgi:hypothetical protein
MEVRQIVSGPGRQQLRHRDWPQRRMPSAPFKILRPKAQCLQVREVVGTQPGKFVQQLAQRFSPALMDVSPHVEWLKRSAVAEFQNHPDPWHPVGALAIDQMAHHIEGGPGALTLVAQGPGVRERREIVSERLCWDMIASCLFVVMLSGLCRMH